MEDKKYKTSNTKMEAAWVRRNLWSHDCFCSNCGFYIEIKETTRLQQFCGRCGFKMKNPQLIKVEFDYD